MATTKHEQTKIERKRCHNPYVQPYRVIPQACSLTFFSFHNKFIQVLILKFLNTLKDHIIFEFLTFLCIT